MDQHDRAEQTHRHIYARLRSMTRPQPAHGPRECTALLRRAIIHQLEEVTWETSQR